MNSRKEYHKKYYAKNQKKINEARKKWFKLHRKESLTNQREYYKMNKVRISAKKKMKALSFGGHIHAIWSCVHKYAHDWKIPCCPKKEFNDWAVDDPTYNELHKNWVASGYDENLSPVVMRKVKKNGYSPENLNWDVKNNYSWWNEDSKVYKQVETETDDYQKIYNKRNKEFRKKLREQWKAKLKDKRK